MNLQNVSKFWKCFQITLFTFAKIFPTIFQFWCFYYVLILTFIDTLSLRHTPAENATSRNKNYAPSLKINLNVVTKQMNETSAPSREHFFANWQLSNIWAKSLNRILVWRLNEVSFESFNQLEYFRIRNSYESPSSSFTKKNRYDR